jgi:hypothetical protein
MEVKFVKPKLSSTSTKEDILFAINQIVAIEKEIDALQKVNLSNYAEFIQEHRSIIKKNTPIVGKTYRFINKDNKSYRYNYSFDGIFDKIEFFYVNYASLKSVANYRSDFMPSVKCIPLDINGHPFKDGNYGAFICMKDYDKGEEINIDQLSEEDYPEMTKVFKKITSKKTDEELKEYNRLKRKFEN